MNAGVVLPLHALLVNPSQTWPVASSSSPTTPIDTLAQPITLYLIRFPIS